MGPCCSKSLDDDDDGIEGGACITQVKGVDDAVDSGVAAPPRSR